jgi:hypothetical protein
MFGTMMAGNIVAFFSRARDFLPVFRGFGEFRQAIPQSRQDARRKKYFSRNPVDQRRRKRK